MLVMISLRRVSRSIKVQKPRKSQRPCPLEHDEKTYLEFGRQLQFALQLQCLLEASQTPVPDHELRLRHLRLSQSFRKVSTHTHHRSTLIELKFTFSNLSATMYLTLQLLSSKRLRRDVKRMPWLDCCSLGISSAMEIKISTVSNRTLS